MEKIVETAINNFCKEIITHSHYCQHCQHYNCNYGICFFAYDCLIKDFDCFKEKE